MSKLHLHSPLFQLDMRVFLQIKGSFQEKEVIYDGFYRVQLQVVDF